MSNNPKQRLTLTDLKEPQQIRELNRQLTWIWDQLLGGLSMKSLNAETKETIDSKADGAVVEEIKETADQAKADSSEAKEKADAAEQAVVSMQTSIEQNEEAIRLKADKTTVDELSGTVSQHSAQFEVTVEQIASTVTHVETLGRMVDQQGTTIIQTAQKIESKAEKSVVDELGRTVERQGTQITQTAEKVETKADKTNVDALGNRVSSAEAALTVQAGEILANATKIETVNQAASDAQGTANGAVQRVTTAEANISALNGKISTKVERTELDALGNKVTQNTSLITQTADAIRSEVASSVSGLQTQIEQTDEQVLILAGKTVGAVNLLKLGDVSFGNSAGTLTGALEERSEAYYCRSRKVMRLFAFSGNYNVGQYDNIRLAKGKEYTVSFWAATGGGDQQLWVNIWNYGRSVDLTLGEVIPVRGGGGYYTRTFTCTETDTYALRFINFGGHTTQIMIMDAKLEEGNTATAWSPNPEEFRTGSSVEITEKRVKISSPETLIAIPSEDGERMIAQFDENGVTAERVHAGNVAYRYDGASTIYVNPNATGAQVAAGNYYRSLADACAAVSGRNLDRDVTINVQGDSYGTAAIYGVCGRGSLTVLGSGRMLTGQLLIGRNTADIAVSGLTSTATGAAAAVQRGPGWVQWTQCKFIGNSSGGSSGLFIDRHAAAFMFECELYNAEHLLSVGKNSDVVCNMLKGGGGTNFLYGDGGNVKWYGTRPDGSLRTDHPALYAPDNLAALTIDYGTAQPSAPVIQTAEYNYLYSDSYRSGWQWFSDDDIRQGYDGGVIYGVIWFDAAAIRSALNGKTINQVSLRLYMAKGVGRGVNVNVELYGSNVSYDRTAAPELTASYGSIGETQPDVVNEITIPAQAVRDMISGAVNALVLRSSDSELHKDRPYSRNYARFAGSTTATAENCPRLTVVYQ